MVLTSLTAIVASDYVKDIEELLTPNLEKSETYFKNSGSLCVSIGIKNLEPNSSINSGFYEPEGCCIIIGNFFNFDEVYNLYKTREPQGYANSNSELVYKLFRIYGSVCFQFLNGRFSIFMVQKSTVFLAADHAATIPLYYKVDKKNSRIYVSNEIKSIFLVEKNIKAALNSEYTISSNTSAFRGVNRVPGGSYIRCQLSLNSFKKIETCEYSYWKLPNIVAIRNDDQSIQLIRESLEISVKKCLSLCTSQTPGVILSGGVDSSIITLLVSKEFPKVNTFSIGMRDCNEFQFAQNVADHCSTVHHEFVISEDDVLRAIPEVIMSMEINSAEIIEYVLALRILYSKIHHISRFILTGYGSDMVFAGNLSPTTAPTSLHDACISEFNSSDGGNEFSLGIGASLGIWTEHPFWTRYVLDSVMTIDPYLKNMGGIPKYVLRQAFKDDLPAMNIWRKKIGNHQSTGIQQFLNSVFAKGETDQKVILARKNMMVQKVLKLLYCEGASPAEIDVCSLSK